MSERRRSAAIASLTALVAFLPFLRGVLGSACLYFRDIALHFFPLRGFALERLREGEVAFWNPYRPRGSAAVAPRARLPARPARRRLAGRGVPFPAAGPARADGRVLLLGAGARARPADAGRLGRRARVRARRILPVDDQPLRVRPGRGVGSARRADAHPAAGRGRAARDRPRGARAGGNALDHGDGDRRPGRRCRPGAGAARQARPAAAGRGRRGAGARRGAHRPRAGAARRTGGRQRARARLSDGGRARTLRSSLRSRPDPGRRPLRQSREHRERVVGPELLPARVPVRAEPVPRRLDAGARRHRDRRPAAARGSPAAAPAPSAS